MPIAKVHRLEEVSRVFAACFPVFYLLVCLYEVFYRNCYL
jgi:hypothetical protein